MHDDRLYTPDGYALHPINHVMTLHTIFTNFLDTYICQRFFRFFVLIPNILKQKGIPQYHVYIKWQLGMRTKVSSFLY